MGATTNLAVSSRKNQQPSAPVPVARISFKMSSSYATGGDTIDVVALVAQGVAAADILTVDLDTSGTRQFKWDRTNGKVKAFNDSDGAEVAATTDLSAVTVTGSVWYV